MCVKRGVTFNTLVYLHLQSKQMFLIGFTFLLLLSLNVLWSVVCYVNHGPDLLYFRISHDQCEREACDDKDEEGRLRLNNGEMMPVLGLGTAGFTDQPTVSRAVSSALAAGYRMIGEDHVLFGQQIKLISDTADLYNNHQQIARALSDSLDSLGLKREDVFLVTKLRPSDLGYLKCVHTIPRLLEELETPYLDLVLIHAPDIPPILGMAPGPEDQRRLRSETWKCLQEFNHRGIIKSIGVSNYGVNHLEEILEQGGQLPQVNQVYMTPLHNQVKFLKEMETLNQHYTIQEALKTFSLKHNIQLQAYSSLGSNSNSRVLKNKVINQIAKK